LLGKRRLFRQIGCNAKRCGTEPASRDEGESNCFDGDARPDGPALSARAASGIVDEVKLGILDHDGAIGGDHNECCVDVNGEVAV